KSSRGKYHNSRGSPGLVLRGSAASPENPAQCVFARPCPFRPCRLAERAATAPPGKSRGLYLPALYKAPDDARRRRRLRPGAPCVRARNGSGCLPASGEGSASDALCPREDSGLRGRARRRGGDNGKGTRPPHANRQNPRAAAVPQEQEQRAAGVCQEPGPISASARSPFDLRQEGSKET